ncbi:MAG: DUF460 domain-containing protein [Candidatus Helarchaeota archaeon]
MKSPLSKHPPTYSLVISQADTIIFQKQHVRKRNVIEYLNNYNVKYLGIDNIFELVKDNNELYKLISKLPIGIKIIQTTGNPAKPYTLKPLKIIAQQNNIKIDHSSPLESAKACIELIKKKIGYCVQLFKDETKIIISTPKVPGHGGQSTNRYSRDMARKVSYISREIQKILDENNIDYDLSIRKSEFGLNNCHILVYSDYSLVHKLIKSLITSKVKIKISPVKTNQVEYLPLNSEAIKFYKTKNLIIGIDPGISIGVAILDLNGKIISVFSRKQMSRNDLRRIIYTKYGIPVVVGTDVVSIPRFIEKFANSSQAIIYHPKRVLKISEKNELVEQYLKNQGTNIKIENTHERDALVSAIKAYQFFEKRFKKAELRLSEMNIDTKINIDEVKKYIIKGYSIFDAISLATPDKEKSIEKEDSKSIISKIEEYDKRYMILKNRIRKLYRQNTILMNKLQRYKLKIKELKELNLKIKDLEDLIEKLKDQQYIEIKKDRTISLLKNEISQLKRLLNEKDKTIKDLKNEVMEKKRKSMFLDQLNLINDFYKIQIIPQFSLESILNADIDLDIVYIENISGGGRKAANELVNKNIRCIIYDTKFCKKIPFKAEEVFFKNKIVTIPADELKIFKVNNYVLINKKSFENTFKIWNRKLEDQLLYEKEKELAHILEDYQKERKKQLQ